MNQETLQLLRELSAKLGTTTEYLWSILIRQAYISGIIDIIMCMVFVILSIILVKLHFRFSRQDQYGDNKYQDDGFAIGMVAVAIALGICDIVMLCSISNIITALINPEYWALEEILSTVKQ